MSLYIFESVDKVIKLLMLLKEEKLDMLKNTCVYSMIMRKAYRMRRLLKYEGYIKLVDLHIFEFIRIFID